MALQSIFPCALLLLLAATGGASGSGLFSALVPHASDHQNYTRPPPQLNKTGFAQCISASDGEFTPEALPELKLMRSAHALSIDDGLLMYLALYAGQRFPVINETWQQPAYERWGVAFQAAESNVVDSLEAALLPPDNSTATLSPRLLFRNAVSACDGSLGEFRSGRSRSRSRSGGRSAAMPRPVSSSTDSDFGPQGDLLCASVVSHNILRALGRRDTYVDMKTGVDYAPQWLIDDEAFLMGTFAPLMQAAMLPLRNDGGGDKWGEWYHTMGLFAWGTHSAALFPLGIGEDNDDGKGGSVAAGVALDAATAYLDTLVAVLVTPNHQREDPVKARVDDDNAGVLRALLTQQAVDQHQAGTAQQATGAAASSASLSSLSSSEFCESEAAYVLPAPPAWV